MFPALSAHFSRRIEMSEKQSELRIKDAKYAGFGVNSLFIKVGPRRLRRDLFEDTKNQYYDSLMVARSVGCDGSKILTDEQMMKDSADKRAEDSKTLTGNERHGMQIFV